jgi:hypothetical protein
MERWKVLYTCNAKIRKGRWPLAFSYLFGLGRFLTFKSAGGPVEVSGLWSSEPASGHGSCRIIYIMMTRQEEV